MYIHGWYLDSTNRYHITLITLNAVEHCTNNIMEYKHIAINNWYNTLPEVKDYTSLSNNKSIIGVSSNMLVLINTSDGSVKSKKDITTLLDGEDGGLWLLEADADIIQSLIDVCYDARENKETCYIHTDEGKIINFN